MRIKIPGLNTTLHTGFKKAGRAKDEAKTARGEAPSRERHNLIPLVPLPVHKSKPAPSAPRVRKASFSTPVHDHWVQQRIAREEALARPVHEPAPKQKPPTTPSATSSSPEPHASGLEGQPPSSAGPLAIDSVSSGVDFTLGGEERTLPQPTRSESSASRYSGTHSNQGSLNAARWMDDIPFKEPSPEQLFARLKLTIANRGPDHSILGLEPHAAVSQIDAAYERIQQQLRAIPHNQAGRKATAIAVANAWGSMRRAALGGSAGSTRSDISSGRSASEEASPERILEAERVLDGLLSLWPAPGSAEDWAGLEHKLLGVTRDARMDEIDAAQAHLREQLAPLAGSPDKERVLRAIDAAHAKMGHAAMTRNAEVGIGTDIPPEILCHLLAQKSAISCPAHSLLGIAPDASLQEIGAAFRRLKAHLAHAHSSGIREQAQAALLTAKRTMDRKVRLDEHIAELTPDSGPAQVFGLQDHPIGWTPAVIEDRYDALLETLGLQRADRPGSTLQASHEAFLARLPAAYESLMAQALKDEDALLLPTGARAPFTLDDAKQEAAAILSAQDGPPEQVLDLDPLDAPDAHQIIDAYKLSLQKLLPLSTQPSRESPDADNLTRQLEEAIDVLNDAMEQLVPDYLVDWAESKSTAPLKNNGTDPRVLNWRQDV